MAEGQAYGGPYPPPGFAHGIGVGGIGSAQANTLPRDSTQVERHVGALRSLHDEIAQAIHRAERVADRLFGCEPHPPAAQAATANKLNAAEPPLLAQLEEAHAFAGSLISRLHQQLSRLERL